MKPAGIYKNADILTNIPKFTEFKLLLYYHRFQIYVMDFYAAIAAT